MTTGPPRHRVQHAILRRRRLSAVPGTVFPVRVLFGSMVLDATAFPRDVTGVVGAIEAGVVFGRLRILVPPGLGIDARVETGARGGFDSEIAVGTEGPQLVLAAAVYSGSITVEQWDPTITV